MKRVLLSLAIFASLSTFAVAQDPAPSKLSNPELDRIKALAGDWVAAEGEDQSSIHTNYRVVSNGSAVVETMFPGTPNEMVTIFSRDGDSVAVTHYCGLGNQPHLKLKSSDDKRMDFDFVDGGNIKPDTDMHMHDAKLEFIAPDEVRWHWQTWNAGKPVGEPHPIHLKRKA